MKKNRYSLILLLLLTISLLSNLIFAYFYFYKQAPYLKQVLSQLAEAKKQTSSLNCQKFYSVSEGKVTEVCPNRAAALSKCSKDFGATLAEAFKQNKNLLGGSSFSDLDKARDLVIKICMQNQGFDY
jgi:hypothetical protein